MYDKEIPVMILVEPQMPENIGAAARAALNFGVKDLRIINPREGWPNELAIRNGAGAFDAISPQIFETLEEAVSDLHTIYATTVRKRDLVKDVYTPPQAFEKAQGKTGFVFGRERTGLENHHIALCTAIVEIPANPDFSSLNLAQAVLVVTYEWERNKGEQNDLLRSHKPAPHAETVNLIKRLEAELEGQNFFREDNLKPTMVNNIRALLTRAHPTEQEIRTFHGMISALLGHKKS